MGVFLFYRDMLLDNRIWLKRVSVWAAVWFAAGSLTFVFNPGLLSGFSQLLDEIFRDILGEEILKLDLRTAFLIFKNNFTVAVMSLFLGIVFGLVPLFGTAVNFFILGFLFAVFAPDRVLVFFVSVIPHGILEIPAFIIAAAFGARLGLDFKNWKMALKQNLLILPFLTMILFLAALIEVFITGNLIEWLTA